MHWGNETKSEAKKLIVSCLLPYASTKKGKGKEMKWNEMKYIPTTF